MQLKQIQARNLGLPTDNLDTGAGKRRVQGGPELLMLLRGRPCDPADQCNSPVSKPYPPCLQLTIKQTLSHPLAAVEPDYEMAI